MFFKHLTLRVKDLEKSIAFYETMAELTLARRFSSGPAELAFLTNGNGETEIELVCIPGGQTFEGKGLFACFSCGRLAEMHALAKERGLNPSPIQELPDGSDYFYVYDPDGFSVQLRAPAK